MIQLKDAIYQGNLISIDIDGDKFITRIGGKQLCLSVKELARKPFRVISPNSNLKVNPLDRVSPLPYRLPVKAEVINLAERRNAKVAD